MFKILTSSLSTISKLVI